MATWTVPPTYDPNYVKLETGVKYDQSKPRMSLMPEGVIKQVLEVLEYGSAKYSDNNWMMVPNAEVRYYDAAHRHLEAWWAGEANDAESGKAHLAHAMCCLAFLMWFDKQEEKNGTNT